MLLEPPQETRTNGIAERLTNWVIWGDPKGFNPSQIKKSKLKK